ncbi:hypothetical protein [Caminibacter pacificus]
MKKSLLLIDEELSTDYRVNKTIDILNKNSLQIINCSKYNFYCSSSFFPLFKNLIFNFYNFYRIKKKYDIKFNSLFLGLKRSVYNWCKSKLLAEKISEKNEYHLIFANDLNCGIVGKVLKTEKNVFIYDSHEIQFHRNRKNSFFRSLFDYSIEKEIVKKADEIRVVNVPIKKLYEDIYNINSSKIKVVNNNHFKCYYGFYKQNFNYAEIGILYIGGGIKGRMLEKLAKEAKSLDIDVFAFFINEIPQLAYDYKWYVGKKDYIEEVKELIKNKTLLMWCVNDTSCLSYKLALPNKFFQAVALGIPVIVYEGTYLADIVKKYDIGYIYKNNLSDIIDSVKNTEKFLKIVDNMNNFQKLIYEKNLVL